VAYNDGNERNAAHVTSNATVLLPRTRAPTQGVVVPIREVEGGDEGCDGGEEVAGEDGERGGVCHVETSSDGSE